MKIKVYVIDMEIPARIKKWALAVGVPAAVVLGGGAVAWASGLVTWTTGQTLQAADLNNNFREPLPG
jgi:phage-related minor tail protein